MSSIRRITGQQFSDGTTIDGDRLEKALQDLEDYINDVPDGDFKKFITIIIIRPVNKTINK